MKKWGLYLVVSSFSFFAMSKDIHLTSSDKNTHLIELYSSQGCSSCPPAESWLRDLQNSDKLWQQVVPVVFHVDYWNDIGWVDPFSKAEFTKRQRKHQRQDNIGSVYTPGFLINGQEWTGFFANNKNDRLQKKLQSNNTKGILEVSIKDSNTIKANYSKFPNETLVLNFAQLAIDENTFIKAGENKNKKVTESFIVLDLMKLYSQNQNWSFDIKPDPRTKAVAVWVSKSDDLTPLQVVGGYL